jgi:hypothetical protein
LLLYVHHRTLGRPDHPVEHPEPGLSSRRMLATASTTILTILPVSVWFLWHYNSIDHDDDTTLGEYIIVYVFSLGIWIFLLGLSGIAVLIAKFVCEVRTVRALKSSGALSLTSLISLGVNFVLLAGAQFLRSGYLAPPSHIGSLAHFLEWFFGFYFTVHVYLMYFLTGIGFLGLWFICMLQGRSKCSGRIRL